MKPILIIICTFVHAFLILSCARPPHGNIATRGTADELAAHTQGLAYGLSPSFTIPGDVASEPDGTGYQCATRLTRLQLIRRNAARYAKKYPQSAVAVLVQRGYKWGKFKGELQIAGKRSIIRLKDGTNYELYWLPRDWTWDSLGETLEVEGLLTPKPHPDSFKVEIFEQSILDLSHIVGLKQ
jgi:hypothetical protein